MKSIHENCVQLRQERQRLRQLRPGRQRRRLRQSGRRHARPRVVVMMDRTNSGCRGTQDVEASE